MFSNIETRAQTAIGESMMNYFVGSVDLTGAEIEFAGHNLTILCGTLGHFDPQTHQVNGSLRIVSEIKPSVLASLVKIRWRDQEFEVMMISHQETHVKNELKLKFVARLLVPEVPVSL
jgi:hypothetical protein